MALVSILRAAQVMSEVVMYPGGDVVLRFVSGAFQGPFLPGYEPTPGPDLSYGIRRIDHVVGNVPELLPVVSEGGRK